ncbi:alkyl sulfatase BDS1-like metallo-beta-lactamase superfamily hydrolase [Caulobacter ginsengisoli]|uniref:Alkyl sulfatase BDS1-like metallo-beta-lactamase superfamily hydrolase n=1 Tax=Caulobacter ginsengisoli TaxID=400775 RepID=A0ABU0IJZ4_9CAUL|nr:alkyl sulfatase dimerization domain-containing protein [Caulobacter ginsengisoli]MDQ0462307.1 alkyl sulfatase BDS1-like metallo-beta-lactamase superfamily hydrolase [Caulobacter ginsengisoli]
MSRIATTIAGLMLTLAPAAQAAPQPASPATIQAQAALKAQLPFADRQDFDFASRGFLGSRTDPLVKDDKGRVVWDLSAYDFLKGEAPATVNPSLWRQGQLLSMNGLFQVSETIWQVRGFDISNITFVKGQTGWIVIDPLTSNEVAKAAYDLVTARLGSRPVVAVIYTHSHADHFGGARGVVSQADYDSGKVRVIGPAGFLEEAVSENVIAGPAMNRRAVYQFGYDLAPGVQGQISSGIGQAVSKGTTSLLPPKESIDHTGQMLVVDGVKIEFQVTPGTEAPAEMNFYFPDLKVLCMAENANASMHNILTPRGAKVRDAKAWADYLSESIRLYGGRTDVMFTSHGWPRFGQQVVVDYLGDHRDAYKFLHDQTVRLMNSGMLPGEIAGALVLPPALAKDWFNRGYYGTMSFNSRAVYQRYMGWYDANPSHLAVLPPAEEGRRYVEAIGGADKVIALARAAYDKGDYGWAATLLNNVVMADAGNGPARALLADAYEQLGYQAESAIWRNMYLTGTTELRTGVAAPAPQSGSADVIANLPTPMIFDLLATRLNPAKVGDASLSVLFVFPDRNERYLVRVHNDVLTAEPAAPDAKADATLTVARGLFLQSLFTGQSLAPKVLTGQVKIDGDVGALQRLTSWFDPPKGGFPIVTR